MGWLRPGISRILLVLLLVGINAVSAVIDHRAYGGPGNQGDHQDVLDSKADPGQYRAACPDYRHFSAFPQ